MNVITPSCYKCGKKTGISDIFGFFKCINKLCEKNGMLVAEDLPTYEKIKEQWKDEYGRIHTKKR